MTLAKADNGELSSTEVGVQLRTAWFIYEGTLPPYVFMTKANFFPLYFLRGTWLCNKNAIRQKKMGMLTNVPPHSGKPVYFPDVCAKLLVLLVFYLYHTSVNMSYKCKTIEQIKIRHNTC